MDVAQIGWVNHVKYCVMCAVLILLCVYVNCCASESNNWYQSMLEVLPGGAAQFGGGALVLMERS